MTPTSHAVRPPATVQGAAAAQLLLRLSTGYVASAALHVIIDLGIADRLATGPRSVVDLAGDTGVSADALARVLRALASVGVFKEAESGVFALTPGAAELRDVPGSMRGAVRWMTDPLHLKTFAEFSGAVRTGAAVVERVLHRPFFDAVADDPQLSQTFQGGMTAMSTAIGDAIVQACSFADASVVVDVGGGEGTLLTSILREWPNLRGILFDTDPVVATAAEPLAAAGISDRCTCVGGDFMADVPAGGDVYLMKHVLHDWPDDGAVAILRNVRAALGRSDRGRLLVIEMHVDEGAPSDAKFMDLAMLALLGGRERTLTQFATLFERSGFELVRVTPTRSPLSLIEARPRH